MEKNDRCCKMILIIDLSSAGCFDTNKYLTKQQDLAPQPVKYPTARLPRTLRLQSSNTLVNYSSHWTHSASARPIPVVSPHSPYSILPFWLSGATGLSGPTMEHQKIMTVIVHVMNVCISHIWTVSKSCRLLLML